MGFFNRLWLPFSHLIPFVPSFFLCLLFSEPKPEMDRLSSTTLLPEAFQGTRDDISDQLAVVWRQIKAPVIVPLMSIAVAVCLAMSLMLFIERVYMGIVIVLVKLFGRKPEKRYKWETMKDDVELGKSGYPMILVQIPMYNEKEVCSLPGCFRGLLCFTQTFCWVSSVLIFCLCFTLVSTGVPTLNWRCMWTLMALRSNHNSSPGRLNRPHNQGNPHRILETFRSGGHVLKPQIKVFFKTKIAGHGGTRMPEMGEQRHKHQVRDTRQQERVQSRSSQGRNETQLR